MKKYIVIFVTCASKKEASKIANALLNKRIIACANIIGDVKSIFLWRGKVRNTVEILLIIKTTEKNFKKVQKIVRKLHSYEVPEIIGIPITSGDKDYLKWIDESTWGAVATKV